MMIYIAITMVENMNIVPNFVGACALSGSDTVSPYHGIRKLTVVKKIREGAQLKDPCCGWFTR